MGAPATAGKRQGHARTSAHLQHLAQRHEHRRRLQRAVLLGDRVLTAVELLAAEEQLRAVDGEQALQSGAGGSAAGWRARCCAPALLQGDATNAQGLRGGAP